MTNVNISKLPNTTFQFTADGVLYGFRLHFWDGLMFCSITINGETIIDSVRCISGKWLIPYKYLTVGGNFRFECIDSSEYPNFNDFGDSCKLVYYTSEEVEALNNG